MSSRDDAVDNTEDRRGAPPGTQRIGWFRYYFDDDRWEWSAEVQRMHGYEPGTVTPTTRLVLAHKHPEDYRQILDTLELIRRTRRSFRSRHRICDVQGNVHNIAVLGDELCDEHGQVIGTYGFYVDLSDEESTREDRMTAEFVAVSQRRSVIEQAKGMLMLAYNLDEAAAFELLVWRSQNTNVKLRDLAAQIVADFTAVGDHQSTSRSVYDELLMTAHERAQGRP